MLLRYSVGASVFFLMQVLPSILARQLLFLLCYSHGPRGILGGREAEGFFSFSSILMPWELS